MTRTRHPVVLVHGVFGYGRRRPLWGQWAPYWPERALDAMRANYLVVDVGVLSSDHDRACEAFYQLYGGRVDYGVAHASAHGHSRYGYTHDTALHPNWSEENPVHLVGHSFGATTAIELYQLICCDYFGVGSSYKWVKSIMSIAGPLSGTTLAHLFGLHDGKMVRFTLGHAIGAALCLWQRLLTHFPVLRNVFDYRMPQWEFVESYRESISSTCRILASADLAVYDLLPARRLARNSQLQHMDKPFLISIVTSTHSQFPTVELSLGVALLSLLGCVAFEISDHAASTVVLTALLLFALLLQRLRDLDYATLPCMTFLRVQMSWCVRWLHEIFDGFDRDEWELNDGAVNVASMMAPMFLRAESSDEHESEADETDTSDSDAGSTASIAASSSVSASVVSPPTHRLDLDTFASQHAHSKHRERLVPGRWYVHTLKKNHLAGTHFDRHSPELFERLLRLLNSEVES